MGERKINFNVPLLSVRRSSTTPTSSNAAKGKKIDNSTITRRHTFHSSTSNYNLEQVTEPVAVPFQWEQIPGKRKDGSVPERQGHKEASATPKRFPPQRVVDVSKQKEEKKPKDKYVFRPRIEANSFNDIVSRKEGVNEKPGSNLKNEDDSDDDDVYSDALDALSPSDSYSVNCSVSGVSGFDSLVVKPSSGILSTDLQLRDFMMSRFLPAAKAMTLEQPHYASRKQPVSAEQPRQITKAVHPNRTTPVNPKESLNIPSYSQDIDDEESEDECSQYADPGITTKGCGLLPRLCVKNSLCLLNPVPAMKVRTQASVSSTHNIKKLTKAAFARSQSPTVRKPAKDAVNKQKLDNEVRSPRWVGVENKLTGGSNRFTYASDRQMISRSSPFRRSGCISPSCNESPQSPFRRGGFPGVPKELENFGANKFNLYKKGYSKSHELVPYHSIRRGSHPVSPTVEKTLYVDTVNVAGLLCSNSGSSDMKKGYTDSAENDLKSLLNIQEIHGTAAVKSSFEDVKCLNSPRGEHKLRCKGLEPGETETDLSLLSDVSPHRGQADRMEDLSQESKALVCISTTTERNLNIENDWTSNIDTGNLKTSLAVQAPLPPLLPKTPSESWLWRTLPSISSQNPSSHLYRGTSFQNKRQDPKISSTSSTKWENIVKSSYLHDDHVRYSEELFTPASQQSKS